MTNTQHTPGPWVVEPRQWDQGASLAIVAPANGFIVAIVPFDEDIQIEDSPTADTVRRHPDEIPNANVLAAAPDLLEAINAAPFIQIEENSAQFLKRYIDWWEKHRAPAFSKARGQQ
jgi:hypothetical protein